MHTTCFVFAWPNILGRLTNVLTLNLLLEVRHVLELSMPMQGSS